MNASQNTLWAGSYGNIIEYGLGLREQWVQQAKYSDIRIKNFECLSLFGNLLFAGGFCDVCIINTADKKVIQVIETAIRSISSLQICPISSSETYLSVNGENPSYSDDKTDLFNISKFQKITFAKEIFSKPQLHLDSIYRQLNNNSSKKSVLKYNNSKMSHPSHEKS
jgi:hypothetical protein